MKNIFKAVFTLTFFAFIDRLLGFVFKIFLSRELGAANLGIYQVALSIFFVLLTLTTSGVPLIISKLTAKYKAEGNKKSQGAIVSSGLIICITVSLAIGAVLLIFADFFSNIFASPISMTLILLLLPAFIFSGVYASFRGNLWGHERYVAVSLLEILEQVVRMAVCFVLFYFGFNKLKMTALSLSVACGVSALACVICYFCYKGRLSSPKGHIIPLIKSSTPITMVRACGSVVNSLIAIAVPFLLMSSGLTKIEALSEFGISIGMALPLLYMPITVVGSLAYVMIPTLSSAAAQNNTASVKSQVEKAINFSIIISALFVPAFMALGSYVGEFVYASAASGEFLAYSAWLLIPLAVENITSSMMNSLDLEVAGFINYMIGAVVLFAIMFCFWGRFSIKVVSIGLGVSWSISCILDFIVIKRKTGISLKFIHSLLICIALIFPSVLFTSSLFALLKFLPLFFSLAISALLGFLFMLTLTVIFGVVKLDVLFSKKGAKKKLIAKS